jgi:membrane-bound inhibitor of C-type lysozyme
MKLRPHLALVLGLVVGTAGLGTELTIHLPRTVSISRKSVEYQCDGSGSKLGVPAGRFTVEYINGRGNSLAVVPVSGNALIFFQCGCRFGSTLHRGALHMVGGGRRRHLLFRFTCRQGAIQLQAGRYEVNCLTLYLSTEQGSRLFIQRVLLPGQILLHQV